MRSTSNHIYLDRINQVIDHITSHYAEPLRLKHLARLAHFSPYHFHRLFSSFVGEPLYAFILRLRLEKAIALMQHGSKTTLTDIALRTGFASSSDFSRAFRQRYGFSPRGYSRERLLQDSKIRQDLQHNTHYHLSKLPTKTNTDRFRVRLVDQPRQQIAYVRVIDTSNMKKLIEAFHQLMNWGKAQGLVPGAQLIGMSKDNPEITPMTHYQFDWCLAVPERVKPSSEVSGGVIPANRYAIVYSHGDAHKEYRAWKYLYDSWLPDSGYEPADSPALERYRSYPSLDNPMFDIDCCLPVQPLVAR
ncbi:MAG: GyrI-like domain-containing protein [Gemmatales bacterium]